MKTVAETVTPEELNSIREILRWKSWDTVKAGILGNQAGPQYNIPDPRITDLNVRIPLAGKTVVELGCYEGSHTVALCRLGAKVIATEGRVTNLVPAMVRCGIHGVKPTWALADVESDAFPWRPAEIYFNVGVLYHLADPVTNLLQCSKYAAEAVFLDTHYTKNPVKDFMGFKMEVHDENEAPRNGLHSISHWMKLADIVEILKRDWTSVEVLNTRDERHGPRATILAKEKIVREPEEVLTDAP